MAKDDDVFGGDPFEQDLHALMNGYSRDPKTWEPYYKAAAEKWGVPQLLLKAVHNQESNFNPTALGPPNTTTPERALGAGQILPSNAKATGQNPLVPKDAIDMTGRMLNDGLRMSNGDVNGALKYYFGGPNQNIWGPKTAQYPVDVLNKYTALGGNLKDLTRDKIGTLLQNRTETPEDRAGQEIPIADPQDQTWQDGSSADQKYLTDPKAAVAPVDNGVPTLAPVNVDAPAAPPVPEDPYEADIHALMNPTPAPAPAVDPSIPVPGAKDTPKGFDPRIDSPRSPLEWARAAGYVLDPSASGSPARTVANAVLLGQLPKVEGAGAALGAGLGTYLRPGATGADALGAMGPAYNQKVATAGKDVLTNNPRDPGFSMLTEMVPAGLMAGAVLNRAGQAARMLPSAVESVSPALARAGNVVGDYLGGSAGGPGALGAVQRAASATTGGIAQGALQGGLMSGLNDASLKDNVLHGAQAGMVMGPAMGIPAAIAEMPFNPKIAPALQNLGQNPEATAVGLRAGQIGQGSGAKTLDKLIGSSNDAEQLVRFNARLADHLGIPNIPGRDMGIDSVKAGLDANGGVMENIAHRTSIDSALPSGPHANLFDALDSVTKDVNKSAYTDMPLLKPVKNTIDTLETDALHGIDGKTYQELTRKGGAIDDLITDPDSKVQAYGHRLKNVLWDSLESTAQQNGNPGDLAALRQARVRYKALMDLHDLSNKTTSGLLSPPEVHAKLVKGFSDNLGNAGELGDLAQVGKMLPKATNTGDASPGYGMQAMRHAYNYAPAVMAALGGAGGGVATGGGMAYSALAGLLGAGGTMLGKHMLESKLQSPQYLRDVIKMNQGGPRAASLGNPLLPFYTYLTAPHDQVGAQQ